MTIVGHFDFNRTAKIESLEKRSLEMAPRLFDRMDFDLVTFSFSVLKYLAVVVVKWLGACLRIKVRLAKLGLVRLSLVRLG